MDFNNLTERLEEASFALRELAGLRIDDHSGFKDETNGNVRTIQVDFNNNPNRVDIRSKVNCLVSSLASVKDLLIYNLSEKPEFQSNPKDTIHKWIRTENLEFGLIVDLNNMYKHTAPLNKKVYVHISVSRSPSTHFTASVSNPGDVSGFFIGRSGPIPIGAASIGISIDLRDGDGNELGSLEKVAEVALTKIDAFIRINEL